MPKPSQQDFINRGNAIVADFQRMREEKFSRTLRQQIEFNDADIFFQFYNALQWDAFQFKNILAQRWEEIKGTYLSYTVTPHSHATQLACLMSDYTAQADEKIAPVQVLMPTIKHFINHVSRDDLRAEPLERIVHLNILSDDNESLIPVEQFSYLKVDSDIASIHINPYLDKPLSENEKNRLIKHSPITMEIVDSFNKFHSVLGESNNLYQALLQLQKKLYNGSVQGSTGGTETEASPTSYQALDDFRTFWNLLSPVQKTAALRAPRFAKVLQEKITNTQWKDECVLQFSQELTLILEKEKDLLIVINLDSGAKDLHLQQIQKSLATANNNLQEVLETKENLSLVYQGHDNLFLTYQQIDKFANENLIRTEEDVLLVVRDLQPQELKILLNLRNGTYKGRIQEVLDRADKLLVVLSSLRLDQLQEFLPTINNIAALFDASLLALINLLTDEAADLFFAILKRNFLRFTSSLQGIEHLSPAKQQLFFKHVSIDELVAATNHAIVFSRLMKSLPVNEYALYLTKMFPRLPALTCCGDSLFAIMLALDRPNRIRYILDPGVSAVLIATVNLESFNFAMLFTDELKIVYLDIIKFQLASFLTDLNYIGSLYKRSIPDHSRRLFLENLPLEKLIHSSASLVNFIQQLKHADRIWFIDTHIVTILKFACVDVAQSFLWPIGDNVVIFNDEGNLPDFQSRKSWALLLAASTTDDRSLNTNLGLLGDTHKFFYLKKLGERSFPVLAYLTPANLASLLVDFGREFISQFALSPVSLADNLKNASVKTIWSAYKLFPLDQGTKFLHALTTMKPSVPSGYEQDAEKSIVMMLWKIVRYQIYLLNQMSEFKSNDNSYIDEPNAYVASLELLALQNPKLKQLKQQYHYTQQLMVALRNTTPEESMKAAREIFKDPRVRFEFTQTHGFWQWVLNFLGLSQGKIMLRLFDKIDRKTKLPDGNPAPVNLQRVEPSLEEKPISISLSA